VTDYDVVVVGGGPGGCSAGVFTAREGLETAIFDCGRSSLKQCASLENYLGFPAGIDIESVYDLFHAHAREAGCTLVTDLVESVEQDGEGFQIHRQEGEAVTARRVLAATRYDGEYLRGLDDDDAMFERHEHDGETQEFFDREYAEMDGSTPVDGLYVVSPHREADMQAIVAAGRGGRVARQVIAASRIERGWWPEAAEGVDWMRRVADQGEKDREYWTEHFDTHYGPSAPVDRDTERYQQVREAAVEKRLSSYLTGEEISARQARGHRALAERLSDEALLDAINDEAVLDSIDDNTVREYADGLATSGGASD